MGKKTAPEVYDRGGVMGRDEVPHKAVVEKLVKDGFKSNITLDLAIGSSIEKEFAMTRQEISKLSLEYTRKILKEAEELFSRK